MKTNGAYALRVLGYLAPFSIGLLLAIAGCPAAPSAVKSAKPVLSAEAALAVSAAGPAEPVPSAVATNASVGGTGPERTRPPRTGVAGSTRGTIACGSSRCAAPAEVCTWDEPSFAWACRAAGKVTADYEVTRYACDDGFDCPDGETCCLPFDHSTHGTTACVPRAEVSSTCYAEICAQGGAKCPPSGTCAAQPSGESVCEFEKGPATCDGKKQCPKDKPICIRDQDKKLRCVEMNSEAFRAVPSEQRWQCTRDADCHGGERCSYSFGEIEHDFDAYCGFYSPAFGGSALCDPTGPSLCRKDAECLEAYQCSPHPNGPPWLGIWGMK